MIVNFRIKNSAFNFSFSTKIFDLASQFVLLISCIIVYTETSCLLLAWVSRRYLIPICGQGLIRRIKLMTSIWWHPLIERILLLVFLRIRIAIAYTKTYIKLVIFRKLFWLKILRTFRLLLANYSRDRHAMSALRWRINNQVAKDPCFSCIIFSARGVRSTTIRIKIWRILFA